MKSLAPARERDEAVWKALADPSRRRILDLLRWQPMTTGALAERFPMSRFGVMKHLAVLADAGLILVRRRGRERWNHLDPVPIQEVHRRWIRPFEEGGADALLRIRERAEMRQGGEAMGVESEAQARDVQLEVRIRASQEAVWRSLTEEVAGWWPEHFYVGEAPRGFVIEQRIGGRVYEDWGDGEGLLWATVLVLRRGQLLQWAGDLAPEFGGPGRSIVTWKLRPEGDETVLELTDSSFGRLSKSSREATAQGWKDLVEGCLKPFAEEGRPPQRPSSVGG